MSDVSQGFGRRLKAERERRGLDLSAVAASTKIARPLLEAMEREDLSRWPAGLYGRSFIRAYVVAVGLAPEPWLAAYAQLVSDDGSSASGEVPAPRAGAFEPAPPSPDAPLTLLLADPPAAASPAYARCLSAAVEWGIVVCVGALASWVFGTSLLASAGAAALLYYPLVSALSAGQRLPWRTPRVAAQQLAARYRRPARSPVAADARAGDGAWHAVSSALQELRTVVQVLPEQVARAAWRAVMRRQV